MPTRNNTTSSRTPVNKRRSGKPTRASEERDRRERLASQKEPAARSSNNITTTAKTWGSENGGVDNERVSSNGAGASTVTIEEANAMVQSALDEERKSLRSSASKASVPSVVANKREIGGKIQRNLNQGMRSFIREKLYASAKFVTKDEDVKRIIQLATIEGYVQVPIGWTPQEFREHMKIHTNRAYSQIRHNSQSLARRYYMGKNIVTKLDWFVLLQQMYTHTFVCCDTSTEDNADGKVPDTFPGTIALVHDKKGDIVLNERYRTDNEDFEYYIHRVLPAINPTNSKFNQRKCKDLISKIYSISDEAFGLTVIYNEYQVWKDQEEMKKRGEKGKMIKKRKRFCSGKSGDKQGWSDEGYSIFNSLCHQVQVRRQETGEFEEQLKQKFKAASDNNETTTAIHTPNHRTSVVREVVPFVDEGFDSMMDGVNMVDSDVVETGPISDISTNGSY